jgi:type IX secretion system substrate protein
MKRIFTFLLLSASAIWVNAQSISPAVSAAQCPLKAMTFTVTLPFAPFTVQPGTVSVQGISLSVKDLNGNLLYNTVRGVVTGVSTTYTYPTGSTMSFTFTGNFVDDNTPQSFVVNLYNTSGLLFTYNFTYAKILSFRYTIPGLQDLTTNLSTISIPACQIFTFGISFPIDSLYANPLPSGNPPPATGSSNVYQYLLPAGWKLGNTVSDGSTWLNGGNSMSITSGTGGDGQNLQIRAVNNACGLTNLVTGRVRSIPIVRPGPVLTLTASDNVNEICSGTKVFTLAGNPPIPAGTIVAWSSTNPAVASVPAGSNQTSVALTKGATDGLTTLTASYTSCQTYSQSVVIRSGAPHTTDQVISSFSNLTNCTNNVFVVLHSSGFYPYSGLLKLVDGGRGLATRYVWSDPGGNPNPNTMFWNDNGDGSVTVSSKVNNGYIALKCTMSNTCGSAYQYWYFVSSNCNAIQANPRGSLEGHFTEDSSGVMNTPIAGNNSNFSVYPNPATGALFIALPDNINPSNVSFSIKDIYGREVKKLKATSGTTTVSVSDLPGGVYFIEIFDGKKSVSIKKIVKN